MQLDAIENFDPRDPIIAKLQLVEFDATDGVHRFIVGVNHVMYTTGGAILWRGSAALKVSSMQESIQGIAPSGSITMSFFQDPHGGSLIQTLKNHGENYILNRDVRFYWLPIRNDGEWASTNLAPILFATRKVRTVTFSGDGARKRSITVAFESVSDNRQVSSAVKLNATGHARLTGSANPSLEFMPTNNEPTESLFG